MSKNIDRGEWISGSGFDLEVLLASITMTDDEQTPLQLLDELFPSNPVVLMERTSHSVWVNSMALKEVGFFRQTEDPPGGRVIRDEESGEAFGIIYDSAGDMVLEQAWNAQLNTSEKNVEGLLAGLQEVAENGITTLGDGRLYWKRGWLDVWNQIYDEGKLTSRVVLRPWVYPYVDRAEQLTYFKEIYQNDPTSRMLINQVKMYSDGIIINNTAKTLDPYPFEWFPGTPYGLNYLSEQK